MAAENVDEFEYIPDPDEDSIEEIRSFLYNKYKDEGIKTLSEDQLRTRFAAFLATIQCQYCGLLFRNEAGKVHHEYLCNFNTNEADNDHWEEEADR